MQERKDKLKNKNENLKKSRLIYILNLFNINQFCALLFGFHGHDLIFNIRNFSKKWNGMDLGA